MSDHPLIVGLHFLLEVAALVALGYWGWTMRRRARLAWAIGLPLLAAIAWAVFRAREDGPEPVVDIPGLARLALEWVILLGAVAALYRVGRRRLALALAVAVAVDYCLSYDRVTNLLGV